MSIFLCNNSVRVLRNDTNIQLKIRASKTLKQDETTNLISL